MTDESRKNRFQERSKKWKHDDEIEWRKSVDQEISRCIRKFGITFDIDWKLIDALDEIEKLFKSEKIRKEELQINTKNA